MGGNGQIKPTPIVGGERKGEGTHKVGKKRKREGTCKVGGERRHSSKRAKQIVIPNMSGNWKLH